MLVDVLVHLKTSSDGFRADATDGYLWCIYACRVGLVSNILHILCLCLAVVPRCGLVGDVLTALATNLGSNMFVMSIDPLVIDHGLDLLMDINLFTLPVNDWRDFVVGVLLDILVGDSVLDLAGVGASDLSLWTISCFSSR